MVNTQTSWEPFFGEIRNLLLPAQLYTDPLRCLAWGNDASFYRMIPRLVIEANSDEDIINILRTASKYEVPITFRASGTSLSGQSITESVLVLIKRSWDKVTLADDLSTITTQPGILGGRIQQILKPHDRRITPDPASIESASIGGIIINNASGMSCGTHANSDVMLQSAQLILADGTLLDTGSASSREAFKISHAAFLDSIIALRDRIMQDSELTELIKTKYAIKNVTGLNLLPFVRFTDPFDIIAHALAGSEGTLAFLSTATLRTEPINKCKASALICFDSIYNCCKAVQIMKPYHPNAVELFDRKALKSIESHPALPPYFKTLPAGAAALLVEVAGQSIEDINKQISILEGALTSLKTINPISFTSKESEYSQYWQLRSGIFPSVGAMRQIGTSCLIEDVAFPLDKLPEAAHELELLIEEYNYTDGVIYGHALEGNFHFIINQAFDNEAEVNRYHAFMEAVVRLVVDKYHGSLKAEHGTGRNMAPYVEHEWGKKAYAAMKELKAIFDPKGILNPGVIFNEDPNCHIQHLKPLPATHPSIDRCIECGFCERSCVTAEKTLSARQRIVLTREMNRIANDPSQKNRLERMFRDFRYQGVATCAGDGLCATTCPMKINTADLTHLYREHFNKQSRLNQWAGSFSEAHFEGFKTGAKGMLYVANTAHTVLGTKAMQAICSGMHNWSKQLIPLWTPAMPLPLRQAKNVEPKKSSLKVVYFPSCINQTFGASHKDHDPLHDVFVQVMERAGYEVIYPEGMKKLCCGTIWESKGFPEIAEKKTKELEEALWKASEQGKYPVVSDQSPCLMRMKHEFKQVKPLDSVEFIHEHLLDKLPIKQINDRITIHLTCSTRKMNISDQIVAIAKKCCSDVFIPEEVGCCAFAGDKGFTHPEINQWALRKLKPQIEAKQITRGYSNSRTCEIGLTNSSGIPYQSIVYLVNECSK